MTTKAQPIGLELMTARQYMKLFEPGAFLLMAAEQRDDPATFEGDIIKAKRFACQMGMFPDDEDRLPVVIWAAVCT